MDLIQTLYCRAEEGTVLSFNEEYKMMQQDCKVEVSEGAHQQDIVRLEGALGLQIYHGSFIHLPLRSPCNAQRSYTYHLWLDDGSSLTFTNINALPQIMNIAMVLLLLGASLAGLAAPVSRHSLPYHIFGPNSFPLDSPPICYRRWRHHGHLTFRLTRLDSCIGVFDQRTPFDDTNFKVSSGEAQSESTNSKVLTARTWNG